jgi:hypothetical protein
LHIVVPVGRFNDITTMIAANCIANNLLHENSLMISRQGIFQKCLQVPSSFLGQHFQGQQF